MRRYVAHHTFSLVRERPLEVRTETPGTLWRGVRGRRQLSYYIFHLRDNHLSVVFINLGGGGRDAYAALVLWGAVAVATIHVQCSVSIPRQDTRKEDRQVLPRV